MLATRPIDGQRSIRICLSGRVSENQLSYIDELIQSANDSGLKVFVDLEQVTVLDLPAVRYMAEGERTKFEFSCCPSAIRHWIQRERETAKLASSWRL